MLYSSCWFMFGMSYTLYGEIVIQKKQASVSRNILSP